MINHLLVKMAQLENPKYGCKRFVYADSIDTVTIIAFDDDGWTGEGDLNKLAARNLWDQLVHEGWKAAITSKLVPELKRQRPI
ncbi:MAG: hypothetical protein V3T31_10800 [candidate division Zixibacteria bacterium]